LSIVREKERGTMEQVRMAPLNAASFVVGKTVPYFVVSLLSAFVIIVVAMALLVAAAAPCAVAVSRRRARSWFADLERGGDPAGGVSGGAPRLVPADADA